MEFAAGLAVAEHGVAARQAAHLAALGHALQLFDGQVGEERLGGQEARDVEVAGVHRFLCRHGDRGPCGL